jgi:hypothetical protein
VLWAVLLVGVAAAAGFAHLSSWIIVGVVFAAWVIVAVSERKLSGPWTTRGTAAQRLSDAGDVLGEPTNGQYAEAEFLVEPESSLLSVQAIADEPDPVAPTPRRRIAIRKAQPAPPTRGTQWNVWTLEEVVRENAPDNDELVYLTVSLRDFADANGLLPPGFDPLVRESFGALLPST